MYLTIAKYWIISFISCKNQEVLMNTLPKHDITASFWEMADMLKDKEKYRIDKNLRYLALAPLSTLKKVFIQYRFFTHFYITDLSILISKLPLGEMRSILAEILAEELGDGKAEHSHPELYDNFLKSLGINDDTLLKTPDPFCLKNLTSIQQHLIEKPWAYGVGLRGMGGECLCQIYLSTMHEYFSKNSQIQRLKNQIDWKFWEIHIGEIDLHHQVLIRNALNHLIQKYPEVTDDLVYGYRESKEAWDEYWERIFMLASNP